MIEAMNYKFYCLYMYIYYIYIYVLYINIEFLTLLRILISTFNSFSMANRIYK